MASPQKNAPNNAEYAHAVKISTKFQPYQKQVFGVPLEYLSTRTSFPLSVPCHFQIGQHTDKIISKLQTDRKKKLRRKYENKTPPPASKLKCVEE